MTIFRPCIDLHEGRVKQIVGGSLREGSAPKTNFVSDRNAEYYARLYRDNGLRGGHVILLGPGNESEAKAALRAFSGGLQVGGGIHPGNAIEYLDAGASHVIMTSWLFPGGLFSMERLQQISTLVGRERLVVDLSCRRRFDKLNDRLEWFVAINRWQTVTPVKLNAALFTALAPYCAEYLIHAADVEGLRQGVDWELVRHLSLVMEKPLTYAGGAASITDLERMQTESLGGIDLTIGSALDIFGGSEVRFQDCVEFNRRQPREN